MSDPIVVKDYVLTPFFLLIVYLWSRRKLRRIEDPELKVYFRWGLWLRVFGAIFLGLVYQYYYHGGDTYGYYFAAQGYAGFFVENPIAAVSYLINGEGMESIVPQMKNWDYVRMFKTPAELMTLKLTGVANLLALNSYLSTSVLFGWISFVGAWKLFKVFQELAPGGIRSHAIAALLIPSVIFWGSGILKDSVTMTAICFLTYHSWQLFGHSRKIVGNGLVILVCVYLIGVIKGYILLAFAPALIFFLINQFKYRLRSSFARAIVTPAFLAVGFALAVVFVNRIGSSLGKYSLENLESVTIGTQTWHAHQSVGRAGSGYALAQTDFSPSGLARQLAPAVNVALFRPYLWEAREPLQFISALEAGALLALTLFGLWKAGIKGWFLLFGKYPFLQFCLIFSIIFAFAVGLTSVNFGALVRYRIPCLPFFAMFVMSMVTIAKASRQNMRSGQTVLDETLLKTSR